MLARSSCLAPFYLPSSSTISTPSTTTPSTTTTSTHHHPSKSMCSWLNVRRRSRPQHWVVCSTSASPSPPLSPPQLSRPCDPDNCPADDQGVVAPVVVEVECTTPMPVRTPTRKTTLVWKRTLPSSGGPETIMSSLTTRACTRRYCGPSSLLLLLLHTASQPDDLSLYWHNHHRCRRHLLLCRHHQKVLHQRRQVRTGMWERLATRTHAHRRRCCWHRTKSSSPPPKIAAIGLLQQPEFRRSAVSTIPPLRPLPLSPDSNAPPTTRQ